MIQLNMIQFNVLYKNYKLNRVWTNVFVLDSFQYRKSKKYNVLEFRLKQYGSNVNVDRNICPYSI